MGKPGRAPSAAEASDRAAVESTRPAEAHPSVGGSTPAGRVLAMQRRAGNRATARLLARDDVPYVLPPVPHYQLQVPERPPLNFGTPKPDYTLKVDPSLAPYLAPGPGGSPPQTAQVWPPKPPIDLFPKGLGNTPPNPPSIVEIPAPATAPKEDPPAQNLQVGYQWSWTAEKKTPDKSIVVTLTRGAFQTQVSVNPDTGQWQWAAGAQPQVSTPDWKIGSAVLNAQAFVSILGAVTFDRGAAGSFSIQAAAGAQITLKWGPITVQAQAGPQVAWSPEGGWSKSFTFQPGAGPSTDRFPGGFEPPGGGPGGLPPVQGGIYFKGNLPWWLGG